MAAPVKFREDLSADRLRDDARLSKDGPLTRRLLALAMIYDGGTRSEAAKLCGVGLQTLRDWVLRFIAEGVARLVDKNAPGSAKKISDAQREELMIADRGRTYPGDPRRGPLAAVRPLPMVLGRARCRPSTRAR